MCSEGEQGIIIVGSALLFLYSVLRTTKPRPCPVPQFPPGFSLAYQFDQTIVRPGGPERYRAQVAPYTYQMAETPTGGLVGHGEDGRVDGGKREVSIWSLIEWPVRVA